MTAFILGNGLSRKDINLNLLKQQGQIYGCNALHREFIPDVLVATDKPIAKQIQESGYAKNHKFYTRRPIEGLGALPLSSKYFGYSSGPNALGVACMDGHARIYLLGFDMGPNVNNLFNNIYADTEFYKTSTHPATFAGNWVKQITQICKDYPDTQFIRVYGITTAQISDLNKIINLQHRPLADFAVDFNLLST